MISFTITVAHDAGKAYGKFSAEGALLVLETAPYPADILALGADGVTQLVYSMPKLPIREQMAAYKEIVDRASPPAERPAPKSYLIH